MKQANIVYDAASQSKMKPGTIAWVSHALGAQQDEPLLFGLAGMVRYARAYEKAYESKLAEDGVLGVYFLDAIKGLRGLLNGDGAVAMERDITTDSKDNGTCEHLFWLAMEAAGFKESDL